MADIAVALMNDITTLNTLMLRISAKAYKLAGKTDFRGLPISIETKKGQTREGVGADGKPWKVIMPFDYGYIRGTEGADNQHVDCFIGPDKDADEVYVIHQCKEDDPNKYDEDKVMLGFGSLDEAIKAYKSAYTGVDLFKGSHTFNFADFVDELHKKSNRGKALECQNSKYWYGFDLDGTLAKWDGFKGDTVIGKPIKKMIAIIKDHLAKGDTCKIFTARVHDDKDGKIEKAIQAWCKKYIGQVLEITNAKDPEMVMLYDDRATGVEKNTGKLLSEPQLKAAMSILAAAEVKAEQWQHMRKVKEHRMKASNWRHNPIPVMDKPLSARAFKELPLEIKEHLAKTAPMAYVNPRFCVTNQPYVLQASIEYFAKGGKEEKKPLLLLTEEGLYVHNGNHRAVTALVCSRELYTRVIDVRGLHAGGPDSKIKCPDCKGSDYVLMPTDFETAKCVKCGTLWQVGSEVKAETICASCESGDCALHAGGPGSGRHKEFSEPVKDAHTFALDNEHTSEWAIKARKDGLTYDEIEYIARQRVANNASLYADEHKVAEQEFKDYAKHQAQGGHDEKFDKYIEAGGPGSGRTPYKVGDRVGYKKFNVKIAQALEDGHYLIYTGANELTKVHESKLYPLERKVAPQLPLDEGKMADKFLRHAKQQEAWKKDIKAGGQGSGWTHEGGHVSHKTEDGPVDRLSKEQSRKDQKVAESHEPVLAKLLGGKSYPDSEPIDVIVRNNGRLIGIEVKVLLYQKNDKLTMNKGAIPRKLKWAKKTGGEIYTVAIDTRDSQTKLYFRPGVGSWHLKDMKLVNSLGDLKKLLGVKGASIKVPDKFPKTKEAFGVAKDHKWTRPPDHLRKFSILKERVGNLKAQLDEMIAASAYFNKIQAGGPGSGWYTENGHVSHEHMNAGNLHEHLQSLSKNPLPDFVKKAAKSLDAAGLDKRYFESRLMTKFRTADKLAIHPLAIANYNESKRMLEFRNDAHKDDVTHELAHHLDLTFLRKPDKQPGDKMVINKALAAKVISDYTSEWQAAKDAMKETIGHKFNFTNDYQKMADKPGLQKNIPTLYALDSAKEWFAESLSLYAKGGQYRDRLERIAPKTAAAVKTVLTGRIFK